MVACFSKAFIALIEPDKQKKVDEWNMKVSL